MAGARPARALALVLALSAGVACSTQPGPPPDGRQDGATGEPGTALTVFAAASLRDAFEALAERYAARPSRTPLDFSFDASSALRARIELGAPADVFVSAAVADARAVAEAGLAVGAVQPFATTPLAVIVPPGDPAGVGTPAGLARPGVRVVAANEGVPISRYARTLLQRLSGLRGYGPGFAADVARNVVSREDNVRGVVAKIELGEADAAIVYAADAATADVATLRLPDAARTEATYAAVALRASGQPERAEAFVAWLAGPETTDVLDAHGFGRP